MPDPNNILIAAPIWEDLYLDPEDIPPEVRDVLEYRFSFLTEYTGWYASKIVEKAVARGFNVTLITGDAPTRELVESELERVDPLLFVHADHGSSSALLGLDGEEIVDLENAHVLAGRITYTISCLSAAALGPAAVDKGCLAYIGYAEPAWVMLIKWKRAEDAEKIMNWDEVSMAGFIAGVTKGLLVGRTAEEAWVKLYSMYTRLIDYYDAHRDPYGIWLAAMLVMTANRNALRLLGEGSAVVVPTEALTEVPMILPIGLIGIMSLGMMSATKLGE